jgi:hypothetical protein
MVSNRGTAVRGGNSTMVRALSFHVVVVGAKEPPRAAPSGGRVAEASFPARHREELLSGVLNCGLMWGRYPTTS